VYTGIVWNDSSEAANSHGSTLDLPPSRFKLLRLLRFF